MNADVYLNQVNNNEDSFNRFISEVKQLSTVSSSRFTYYKTKSDDLNQIDSDINFEVKSLKNLKLKSIILKLFNKVFGKREKELEELSSPIINLQNKTWELLNGNELNDEQKEELGKYYKIFSTNFEREYGKDVFKILGQFERKANFHRLLGKAEEELYAVKADLLSVENEYKSFPKGAVAKDLLARKMKAEADHEQALENLEKIVRQRNEIFG